jgi:hypothetical protein
MITKAIRGLKVRLKYKNAPIATNGKTLLKTTTLQLLMKSNNITSKYKSRMSILIKIWI